MFGETDEPATDKQIKVIKDLKLPLDTANLTKYQAYKAINSWYKLKNYQGHIHLWRKVPNAKVEEYCKAKLYPNPQEITINLFYCKKCGKTAELVKDLKTGETKRYIQKAEQIVERD